MADAVFGEVPNGQEYDFVRCMCIASAYLGDFQFSQLLDEVCSSTYRRQKSAKA